MRYLKFKNHYTLKKIIETNVKKYDKILEEIENNSVSDWNDYVERIPMLKEGIKILEKIEEIGGEDTQAYIVGGTIRDIITGNKEPDDIDIATNVPIEKLEEHFETFDIGKNKDFGILVIKSNGFEFEIANFRQDGEYADGRRPDSVEIVMDFEGDAQRRDFTINAMGVDKDGNIIDYFDGQGSIKNKVIKTVGDPEKRFSEDYLRMLRAVRFASRLDFEIDEKTFNTIKKNAHNVKGLSKERILKELKKMASQEGYKFANALNILYETDLLKYILPEVFEMNKYEHHPKHHPEGNVYEHTLSALRSNDVKDPLINLGILFHDIGKIKSHSIDDDGVDRYFGHAQSSFEMIDDIAKELNMDNKSKDALKFSALNHMKFHDLLNMSNSKILKLMEDDNWDLLYHVAKADVKARGEMFDEKEWNEIEKHIDELKEKFNGKKAIDNIKKIVNGKLIKQLRPDLNPGPIFGDIINSTIDWILNENIDVENDKEIINNYIKNYNEKK